MLFHAWLRNRSFMPKLKKCNFGRMTFLSNYQLEGVAAKKKTAIKAENFPSHAKI